MQKKKFQKQLENFVCEVCNTHVAGDGYTNHCPECLASKHVDIHPGDRAATCGGIMKVVKIELEKGNWIITHQCLVCNYTKRNKVHKHDNIEKLAAVQKELGKQL